MHTDGTDRHVWDRLPRPLKGGAAVIAGAASAGLTTALCALISGWLPDHGVAIFYLLTVVASAVAFGMLSGLATATATFLAYNYFFVQPTYTFSTSDPRDLVALLVFFAVAIAAGSLAGRLREVAEQARQRTRSLETLNALAVRLAAAMNEADIARSLVSMANKASGKSAVILSAPAGGDLSILQKTPEAKDLSTADWQAAQRCAASRQTVYPAVAGWPGADYEFRPILVRNKVAGVLGVHQPRDDDVSDTTLEAMVKQAAIALERLSLEEEKGAAEKQVEAERLKSALLSSVSHDIKTPLAAIQGAVTSLRQLGSEMPDESKNELLAAIEEETVRLTRFVTNMLDMMRLDSGPPEVAKDWIDLADTLGRTVAIARRTMPNAVFSLDLQVSPAIVRGDELLLEHVFLNVIENAVNASPANGTIKVTLRRAELDYRVEIEDRGEGISPDALPRIFDKFYRAPGIRTRGSGIGLTICKEVMTALGGTIAASSPIASGQGTRVTLNIPQNSQRFQDGTGS
ncbi:MAG: DUF4118 domain-containing protein [Hyphomicrobiaceae bacterium]